MAAAGIVPKTDKERIAKVDWWTSKYPTVTRCALVYILCVVAVASIL